MGKMKKKQNSDNIKTSKNAEKIDHSYNAVPMENAIGSLWKTICQFLTKLHMQPPQNQQLYSWTFIPGKEN